MAKLINKFNSYLERKFIFWAVFTLAILVPFSISLWNVIQGNIPFWYDPARDLLSAWDNLHKITLIGPTSGIPGIFYGPYWIWLLSLGLMISKNPRVVDFVVETLPYYAIFLFILFQFSNLFGKKVILTLWLLFIFTVGFNYTIMLWNPHPAPILFITYVYLITFFPVKNPFRYCMYSLCLGLILGLLLNFHISFAIGVVLGTGMFFIIQLYLLFANNKIKQLHFLKEIALPVLLFIFGLSIIFAPFFLFELRHNFPQTKVLLQTFFKFGNVVTIKGLSKKDIILSFFGRSAAILSLPKVFGLLIGVGELIFASYLIIRNNLKDQEKRILLLLLSISIGVLSIYLTAKNPVWDYHFISVEIIFLLLLGIILTKSSKLAHILLVYAIFIASIGILHFSQSMQTNPYSIPNLITKEYVTHIVLNDAKGVDYNVFIYNPAIYTYDYSYLFAWLGKKNVPFDPGKITEQKNLTYLIYPATKQAIINDFIEYRTPKKFYITAHEWHIADGTTILKRVKITSSNI